MRDIFIYTITEKDENIYLDFEFSNERLEGIQRDYLGKMALFTDRSDFTNEQIVLAYRSAWHVESAFRHMITPKHLTVRPIFHWTDEKICVHVFVCILTYRLCCLLVKELLVHGIHISINQLMQEMSRIKRVHTFFGEIKKPQKIKSFTLGSELAGQIEQIYNLKDKYN
jgi:transposase